MKVSLLCSLGGQLPYILTIIIDHYLVFFLNFVALVDRRHLHTFYLFIFILFNLSNMIYLIIILSVLLSTINYLLNLYIKYWHWLLSHVLFLHSTIGNKISTCVYASVYSLYLCVCLISCLFHETDGLASYCIVLSLTFF